MSVSPIPEGCNTVNIYLVVKDARAAIDFYKKAFHGEGGSCMTAPDGSVMHGEVRIGNSTIMLSQENPQWNMKSPETLGGSPASIHLYVDDCDAVFNHAIESGCKETAPLMDTFWGDRYGKLADPFGFEWGIATRIEILDEEELQKRGDAWFAEMAKQGAEA